MHMDEWRDVMADERDRPKVIKFDRELRKRDPHAWLTDEAVPIDQANFDDSNEVLFGREVDARGQTPEVAVHDVGLEGQPALGEPHRSIRRRPDERGAVASCTVLPKCPAPEGPQ